MSFGCPTADCSLAVFGFMAVLVGGLGLLVFFASRR